MDAEDLIVDDGSQGQEIKHLRTILPNIQTPVLPQALIVETVDLRDLP